MLHAREIRHDQRREAPLERAEGRVAPRVAERQHRHRVWIGRRADQQRLARDRLTCGVRSAGVSVAGWGAAAQARLRPTMKTASVRRRTYDLRWGRIDTIKNRVRGRCDGP